MKKTTFILFVAICFCRTVQGQVNANYIKQHSVAIKDANQLNNTVHQVLAPFHIILFGEMHGTNESTPFINGLVNLLTSKGDSVLVGLEIPSLYMKLFLSYRTDSSIFQSEFFRNPPYESGKESVAWAKLIANLNRNPRVQLFFFDANENEKSLPRDSVMYAKIKAQYLQHPTWRMVTLSGNYHNKLNQGKTMGSLLKQDKSLQLSRSICSLNMEFTEGTCLADFGNGLEVKQVKKKPSEYSTSVDYNNYLLLLPSNAEDYPYTGLYYTKHISAAKMATAK